MLELFQKLHLQIYASQFVTSLIILLSFALLYLGSVERKWKNYKKLNVSRNSFRSFSRATIWWKNKNLIKIADTSFKEENRITVDNLKGYSNIVCNVLLTYVIESLSSPNCWKLIEHVCNKRNHSNIWRTHFQEWK